jgi:hypothetical protein
MLCCIFFLILDTDYRWQNRVTQNKITGRMQPFLGFLGVRKFRNSTVLKWAIQEAQLASVGSEILFLQTLDFMGPVKNAAFVNSDHV